MAGYGQLSVMVVEDSTVQRNHVVALLHSLEVDTVLEAADGNAALAQLRARPVDVLMTDLEMPGMDGVDLVRRLAEERLCRALAVFSGRGHILLVAVKAMAQEEGLDVLGVIDKPVSANAVDAVLARFGREHASAPGHDAAPPVALDELAAALREGQLVVYYQPKVTAMSGVLYGVEALVRWQHPRHGFLLPSQFVPAAEEGGMIDALTDYVLAHTIERLQDWHRKGLRITAAVNLSAKSLPEVDLADRIALDVERRGIEARYLVLEITETAVVSDLALSLGTLARFRLKGFGLSIDDYGTGFSSMQQLARIPFTELKIDRSLVDGAAGDPQLHVMLKSTVDMGRKLHLTTVAEGVEQVEDWHLVRRLGVDVVQGFYVAKPMPGDELPNWLKHGARHVREQIERGERPKSA